MPVGKRGTARSPWCSSPSHSRCRLTAPGIAGSEPQWITARLGAMSARAARPGYELEVEDTFRGECLDGCRWVAHYLPQWTTKGLSAACCEREEAVLHLRIE